MSAASGQRMDGVDGLRGLAVLAVVLFHLDIPGVFEGGFFGVDVFFVISGFLITWKIAAERAQTGTFDYRHFLDGRLWRLFPAAFVMVFSVAAITFLLFPSQFVPTVADLPAAFGYASNIWQISSQQDYFAAQEAPPALRHLWSLAIEQQYYLVWPLVVGFAFRHRLGVDAAIRVALGLAALSFAWMALLYEWEPSLANRIYLGTDTHAGALLVGSALGAWAVRIRLQGATAWPIPVRLLDAVAVVSAAVLAYAMWSWNQGYGDLYHWGFAVVALASAGLLLGASQEGTRTARLLATQPLLWIGTRSYSIYLWHWPLFVWIRWPEPSPYRSFGWTLVALVVTGVAAEASCRWFEHKKRPRGTPSFAPLAYSLLVVPLVCAGILSMGLRDHQEQAASTVATASTPATGLPAATGAGTVAGVSAEARTEQVVPAHDILLIGDSVMLGAREQLVRAFPGLHIDAAVGRQFSDGLKMLQAARDLPPVVILHLGTNGYITESHALRALQLLRDHHVVLVNVHASRRWTEANNEVLQRIAAGRPNVRLVDWHAAASGRDDYFVKDGIHLSSLGIRAVSALLGAAARIDPASVSASNGRRRSARGWDDDGPERMREDKPVPAGSRAEAAASQPEADTAPATAPTDTPKE